MNSKIVVIGSCNIDLQCFTPRLPRPGETLHGTEFRKGFGGKGANQCVAAAKLGSSTAMIARLGNDSFGQEFHRALKDNKINTDYVLMTDGVSSGLALITVAQNGIAIVNAAPAVTNPDPLVFRLSDIFCVNESEAEVLTGMAVQSVDEAKVAVGLLLDKGCKQVIITLGASGAVFASQGNLTPVHVPTKTVKSVDSTGAGDMFVGGLAFYLAYYPQLPMREIVKRSCEVATVSVQNYGTQTSFPTKDDLPTELFL
ncbi:Ribokinase [Cryptotermes secundus]|uniref:Ribokinase n=2 Tax=Cryptotermes secundus TaxID=105785 RepID=A0A2J7PNA5_9NEOP|nr:ribokinase isoform X1 [Cryptotermes secundus]PNF17811.1 Ribokinase [Cryptotermes secundus]